MPSAGACKPSATLASPRTRYRADEARSLLAPRSWGGDPPRKDNPARMEVLPLILVPAGAAAVSVLAMRLADGRRIGARPRRTRLTGRSGTRPVLRSAWIRAIRLRVPSFQPRLPRFEPRTARFRPGWARFRPLTPPVGPTVARWFEQLRAELYRLPEPPSAESTSAESTPARSPSWPAPTAAPRARCPSCGLPLADAYLRCLRCGSIGRNWSSHPMGKRDRS